MVQGFAVKRQPIDWKIRPLRRRLALPAVAKTSDGTALRIMLSNISYEGCHILAEGTFSVGDLVEVNVPGMGLMPAQVRWSSEDQAGLRFLLGDSTAESRRARIGV